MDFIARPLGQFLMFLYDLVGNYGVAMLLFSIAVKVILLPFQMKSKRGMMRQSRFQPKIEELKKKHGANKTKLNEAMAQLYKEEGFNPASGCLWSILPLPIMFALFFTIRAPITMMMGVPAELLAVATHETTIGAILARIQSLSPELAAANMQIEQAQFITENWRHFSEWASDGLRQISFNMGPINLGAVPQWDFLWNTDWSNSSVWLPGLLLFIIPFISAGSQFVSAGINRKIAPQTSPEGAGGSMQKMMMMMPLMSVWFGFMWPAALAFYWTVGTVFQIGQDIVLTKHYTKIMDAEDAIRDEERKKKEAELEAKRLETERKKAEGTIERDRNTSKRKKQKSDRQEQRDKAAEWEKKRSPTKDKKSEPGRVDDRRYARGRAYDPDRYSATGGDADADAVPDDETDYAEPEDEAVDTECDVDDSGDDDGDDSFEDDGEDEDNEGYDRD